MLSIFDRSPRLCDGISRRAVLQAGGIAAMGWAASPIRMLGAESKPDSNDPAKRCIVLFLLGGPPQHSTWDPKPTAPKEIRGEFQSIDTAVPGIQVGELLPTTATLMQHVAILRAVVTGDNAHSSSGYYMMTGVPHQPKNRENANPGPPNNWPTMGAVVQHLSGRSLLLPAAVRLPHHIFNTDGSVWPGQDSGWLGHRADPWLFNCEPASPEFDVPQFRLRTDVTLDRLSKRQALLEQLETQLREVERSRSLDEFSSQQRQVFDLLTTHRARTACDLKLEPEKIRDRYGRSQFGQSVLLARRLIEADVQFVQVNWFRGPEEPNDAPCWDSHSNETQRLKTVLLPPFDQAFSALLSDLERRGLLEETLVVAMAEFGRTPKFNSRAGRDHWGHVFSIALAGGGIRGGQAFGSSDNEAAYPRDGIVHPQDITATIFHQLGYSAETIVKDPLGRPSPISQGETIKALI